MRDAPGALLCRIRIKNILFLHATAGNSERSSDGCEEGDCNLQNRFQVFAFIIFILFLMLSVIC